MVYIIHKSKTEKTLAILITVILIELSGLFIYKTRSHLLNLLAFKIDIPYLIGIVCIFATVILIFIGIVLPVISLEYVLTDKELIIRSPWSLLYRNKKIAYSDIEHVFLFVSWDRKGREELKVLIKRYGPPSVSLIDSSVATLIFLVPENPEKFVQDLRMLIDLNRREVEF